MFLNDEDKEKELTKWNRRIVKTCLLCNGTGIKSNLEEGKLDTYCICMKKVLFFTSLIEMGIPEKFVQKKWEDYKNEPLALEKVKDYVENFSNHYDEGIGLYLYGEFGRGKTMLESLAGKYIVAQKNEDTNENYKISFYLFEELIQLIRLSRYDLKLRNFLEVNIAKVDLLILDNLGSENTTKNEEESHYVAKTFEYFLRKRDFACLPTIISSNILPEDVDKYYSESIAGLIDERMIHIKVEGENFRKLRSIELNIQDDIDNI